MKQLQLQVFGDSRLVVNKLLGSYEAKKPELRPYHNYAKKLMGWIGDVIIQHVPRKENKKFDALAALTSSLTLPDQAQVTICQILVVVPPNEGESEENELEHLVAVSKAEKEEWRQPIIDYLSYGILSENPRRRTEIRHFWTKAPLPYKKDGILLANDGPLPKSSGGHLYILASTNYFSKWAKVVALKEVKKVNIASFIRVNIIYRFGITRYIITDNGKPFDNRLMNKISHLFGFKHHNSSMYNATANGPAEAFNKTLCNLLKKVVPKSK
ncbi:uncharacterized protein [Nicotiana tomentosiformis]|uniref:uncharacterized protein n=1 Tax=Nicotiana tomentosiformis TaxID=4098 RepID=UPI00388C7203